MPELPEVETVKEELKKHILGKVLDKPKVFYTPVIKTDLKTYQNDMVGKKILSITREGKFIIFHLSDKKKIIFHLRMEGKLFVVDKNEYDKNHLSLLFPFKNDEEGLAFYDVRKFGVTYYLDEDEKGPLEKLGKEPFDIKDSSYLYERYKKSNKPVKELLLDQSIMCGLGNIYADEVLFASKISPFKLGKNLNKEECEDILKSSIDILNVAIKNKGSTIRTYKASQHVKGSYQKFLKVYSHENQICSCCNSYYIKKRKLDGRGTSYCSKCQHSGYCICLTGKIAAGKSEALKILKDEGFKIFSADEIIRDFYQDKKFLKELKYKFPDVFNDKGIDKELIYKKLFADKKFESQYLNVIYSSLKEKINEFIIINDGFKKAVEVPRVFDAKMEKLFDFIIGIESVNQKENLFKREKSIKRLSFNDMNSYDEHIDDLTYIIHNDHKLEDLKIEVKKMVKYIDSL